MNNIEISQIAILPTKHGTFKIQAFKDEQTQECEHNKSQQPYPRKGINYLNQPA